MENTVEFMEIDSQAIKLDEQYLITPKQYRDASTSTETLEEKFKSTISKWIQNDLTIHEEQKTVSPKWFIVNDKTGTGNLNEKDERALNIKLQKCPKKYDVVTPEQTLDAQVAELSSRKNNAYIDPKESKESIKTLDGAMFEFEDF